MDKTAIIYARVSTAAQAEEELPIESQLEVCRRKAAELDAMVMREFVDAGISGRTDQRKAFQAALAFCRMNRVDYFVVWNTARFARNRIDAPLHKVQLKKHGTTMVYVTMNVDTSKKEGWMLEAMLEMVDEYYSRQVSDDTVRSMMKNATDGYHNGGAVPFGYRVVPVPGTKRKRLAVDDDEAVVIREIFDHCLAGAGAKVIAMELNRRGRSRRSHAWSKTTISNILCNWVYCGYVIFNRRDRRAACIRPESEWVKTKSHPAIITEEAFMTVHNLVSGRAPREGNGSPKSTHFFTGLLKCGECGRAMMIETATGRSARYSYYNCRGSIKGLGCRPRRIPAQAFDEWLASFIVDRLMSMENLRAVAQELHQARGNWVKERERQRAALVAELRQLESRRRRLYDLLETKEPAALNLGDIGPRIRELNTRELAINRTLTDLEAAEAPACTVDELELRAVQDFVRDVVLMSNHPQKVREFFSTFIEEIIVSGSAVDVNYRKDRLVAVHNEREWLPDQGSNLGPAD